MASGLEIPAPEYASIVLNNRLAAPWLQPVSEHDQSITSTGWVSTDASCTNNPTSCYVSGTQGDFTLQGGDALSNSTQYWWHAGAFDQDNSGNLRNQTRVQLSVFSTRWYF